MNQIGKKNLKFLMPNLITLEPHSNKLRRVLILSSKIYKLKYIFIIIFFYFFFWGGDKTLLFYAYFCRIVLPTHAQKSRAQASFAIVTDDKHAH